mmetsp:Transcript_18813/g.34044  ORF Transcript_18813/g.34044 Transcript_18813/m.34044 type:complete len:101 (+) Transcript_18813:454-756(+)
MILRKKLKKLESSMMNVQSAQKNMLKEMFCALHTASMSSIYIASTSGYTPFRRIPGQPRTQLVHCAKLLFSDLFHVTMRCEIRGKFYVIGPATSLQLAMC